MFQKPFGREGIFKKTSVIVIRYFHSMTISIFCKSFCRIELILA